MRTCIFSWCACSTQPAGSRLCFSSANSLNCSFQIKRAYRNLATKAHPDKVNFKPPSASASLILNSQYVFPVFKRLHSCEH
jgi:hypothetical protein